MVAYPKVRFYWGNTLLQRLTFRSVLLALVFISLTATAQEVDYGDYQRLLDEVTASQEQLDSAEGEPAQALRERAVAGYTALRDWYDGFFLTDDFAALDPAAQAVPRADRDRLEYNIAMHLTALDQCEDSRARLSTLLDAVVEDSELRPLLRAAYDDALTCLNRVDTATLVVSAEPANADVVVDGVFLGLASTTHQVALGGHRLTIRADGYHDHEIEFEADTAGAEIAVGPIALLRLPEVAASGKSPTWYEWTLWGVGAGGITAGIILYFSARDHEDALNGLTGEVAVDPEGEQDIIDTRDQWALISGSVGIAAAITATISFIVRDSPGESDADSDLALDFSPTIGGFSFGLSGRF